MTTFMKVIAWLGAGHTCNGETIALVKGLWSNVWDNYGDRIQDVANNLWEI